MERAGALPPAPSPTCAPCGTLSPVSLLTELDAFLNHRCGELDGGVDEATVWPACECGAGIARRADEGDALDVTG